MINLLSLGKKWKQKKELFAWPQEKEARETDWRKTEKPKVWRGYRPVCCKN